MKVYVFIYVFHLIWINVVAVETVTSCDSKVELRAVLLSCPVKDTGCDDDDPLSQAMAAEEAQIVQSNSKNYRSLKEEKERGFPNAVKDCKRKLIITLKVKNSGKIPCDDEYIVVDHVFDPLTGGRGRLLTPVVLKLRQEQMIQLYGLQFQRVVNSDPFEEEKKSNKACSIDPDNPTCGIAMYDGKPIPFSEGFCCSCDPELNTKRQLSTVSRGDSFFYRDSKLISQRIDRLTREGSSPASIVNPGLVKLKSEHRSSSVRETNRRNHDDDDDDDDDNSNEKEGSCPMRGLSCSLPNFLIEHDRKIVCDKDDFLGELCKLHEEKQLLESKDPIQNVFPNVKVENGEGRVNSDSKGATMPSVKFGDDAGKQTLVISNRGDLNDVAVLKSLMGALKVVQTNKNEHDQTVTNQVTRGKRENTHESTYSRDSGESSLDEKLEKFTNSKNLRRNRPKRLLKLPHERFRKADGKSAGSEEDKDEYVKAPPPRFFFSHDNCILHPGGSDESLVNSTCRSPGENEVGNVKDEIRNNLRQNFESKQDSQKGFRDRQLSRTQLKGSNVGRINEKSQKYASKKTMLNRKLVEGETSGKEGIENEKLNGKTESRLLKGYGRPEAEKFDRGKSRQKGEKKLKEEDVEEKAVAAGESGSRNVVRIEATERENLASKNEKLKLEKFSSRTDDFKVRPEEGERENKKIIDNEKLRNLPAQDESQESRSYGNDKLSGSGSVGRENAIASGKEKLQRLGGSLVEPEKISQMLLNEQKHDRQFAKNRLESASPGVNLYSQRKHYKGDTRAEMTGRRKSSHYSHWKPSDEGNVDFKVEIIRKPVSQPAAPKVYSSRWHEYLRPRVDGTRNRHFDPETFALRSDGNAFSMVKNHAQHFQVPYGVAQKYALSAQERGGKFSYDRHYLTHCPDAKAEIWPRRLSGHSEEIHENSMAADKLPLAKCNLRYFKKPNRRLYVSAADLDSYRRELAKLQARGLQLKKEKEKFEERGYESENDPLTADFDSIPKSRRRRNAPLFTTESSKVESTRNESEISNAFEPARGFLKSKLDDIKKRSANFSDQDSKIVEKLESCSAAKKVTKDREVGGEKSASSGEDKDNLGKASSDPSVQSTKVSTNDRSQLKGNEKKTKKRSKDAERLKWSYATAPNYLQGKRQDTERSVLGLSRADSRCGKTALDDENTQDTAHCMRFGDLWYSVYVIKKPVVAQIVGVQLFDKHGLCDGSTQWRDLTKGKMIRIGTFLPKAEDELPTISMTYVGGKTKKAPIAIDPDNYLLLIPTHVSDPTKAGYYPQFGGGPEEYLVVDSKHVSKGGDCDMIGTSFEAFARQPDRCSRPRGSCLKRQPVDLWREDMEARIRGKRGKYFVENFGTVANSPIKTYTNLTGEFLALEYYGEYTSTIEIEVKADFNALIRKGSNAQIPTVYIDGTYPKKTRIILSVLNIGLTSSYFRPRLGDCPPDLDPAWCPLEGPLVTIPPQQRHDFRLDLSGALPPNKIHVTVQVLNQLNKKVAYRKIVIKKGDRCLCAFHCKCNCIGNADGRTCHRLALEDYRGAGYIGSFPFRGGVASSASESIRTNLRVIFVTAFYVLLLMGVTKGILGIFCRRLGIAGVRVIVGPRKLSKYYECDLESTPVVFDDCGFPVHPTTNQPVQIVALWLEILINFIFFFLYPLRGIWILLIALPCCTIVVEMCDSTSGGEEAGSETDQKSSSPLLAKDAQSTCVNYTMTSINAIQNKGQEYLPYLPYKGDDDPLEEDDTEFVLREMKRYRKKACD